VEDSDELGLAAETNKHKTPKINKIKTQQQIQSKRKENKQQNKKN